MRPEYDNSFTGIAHTDYVIPGDLNQYTKISTIWPRWDHQNQEDMEPSNSLLQTGILVVDKNAS